MMYEEFRENLFSMLNSLFVNFPLQPASLAEMGKTCKIQLVTQVSTVLTDLKQGEHEHQVCEMQGLVEGPSLDDQGECFSPLVVNATSVNVEVYYNKAVNYTLMVTFISFLQVLFLIRQMEHSNTQSGAAKVSLLMIGQQAIMDAYLCLLHLTAGILVGMMIFQLNGTFCQEFIPYDFPLVGFHTISFYFWCMLHCSV
jgi:hypothetical protein